MVNEVEAEVTRQLKSQMDKGVRKYGHGLIVSDGHDWLQEAIEECVDQLQYLVAAKLERDKCKSSSNGSYEDINGELVFISSVEQLHTLLTDTRSPELD